MVSDEPPMTHHHSRESDTDSGYDADSDPDDGLDSGDDDEFYGVEKAVRGDGDVQMMDYYGSDADESP
jgi:hypothetical protein